MLLVSTQRDVLNFVGWVNATMKFGGHRYLLDEHDTYPDNKVHEANMRPTWVLSSPGGPYVGPMNLAIRVVEIQFPLNMHQYNVPSLDADNDLSPVCCKTIIWANPDSLNMVLLERISLKYES